MGGIQIVNQIKTIAYPKTWDYTKGNHDNQLQNNGNDIGGIQIINQIKTLASPKLGRQTTIAHLNTWEATKQTKNLNKATAHLESWEASKLTWKWKDITDKDSKLT